MPVSERDYMRSIEYPWSRAALRGDLPAKKVAPDVLLVSFVALACAVAIGYVLAVLAGVV